MKPYILIITGIFILACGAPAYIAPTDTSEPIYQQNANNSNIPTQNATQTPITAVVLEPLTVRQKPCASSVKDGYKNTGDLVELSGAEYVCPDGGRWAHLVGGGWVNKRYLEER